MENNEETGPGIRVDGNQALQALASTNKGQVVGELVVRIKIEMNLETSPMPPALPELIDLRIGAAAPKIAAQAKAEVFKAMQRGRPVE